MDTEAEMDKQRIRKLQVETCFLRNIFKKDIAFFPHFSQNFDM